MDGDGLPDLIEVSLGTRIDDGDSDGDGMPDGWEVQYGLDPTIPSADLDTDGDGKTDLEEFNEGTDPTHDDEEPEDDPIFMVCLVFILLLLVAVLIIFFIFRRRSDEDEDGEGFHEDGINDLEEEDGYLEEFEDYEGEELDPQILIGGESSFIDDSVDES